MVSLWFFDTRVTIRASWRDGSDAISLIEHWAPEGDSAPLHVHRDEDEVFHLLEGELTFLVAGETRRARTGDSLLAPKGVPHTYRVESREARWLTVTCGRQFEDFVRAIGREAGPGLPEAAPPPTDKELAELERLAAAHGIDLVGPPLD